MIKAEQQEKMRQRLHASVDKRRQIAKDILFDSGEKSETKWNKMTNAIPSNYDF